MNHDLDKRTAEDEPVELDEDEREEQEIEALIQEVEANEEPSGERVKAFKSNRTH